MRQKYWKYDNHFTLLLDAATLLHTENFVAERPFALMVQEMCKIIC